LRDNHAWQTGYLQGDQLAEIEFWLGSAAPAGAALAAAESASGATAHAASAAAA
jgi:hypothetical protein